MKKLFFVATIFLMSCSTTKVKNLSDAKDVFPSKDFLQTSNTKIIVVRDSGFLGGGCSEEIGVNGVAAGELYASEKITLNVKTGRNTLYIKNIGICSGELLELQFEIKENETKFFRVQRESSGARYLTETSF